MLVQFYSDDACIADGKLDATPAVGWIVQIKGRKYTVKSIELHVPEDKGPFGDDPKLRVNLEDL